MVRWSIWFVLLVMVLSGCGTGRPQAQSPTVDGPKPGPVGTAPVTPTPLSTSEAVLQGIALGMTVEQGRELLTNPTVKTSLENGEPYLENGDSTREIMAAFKNDIIWKVVDRVGPFPRGLAIGDGRARVVDLYGEPTEEVRGYLHYLLPDGTRFVVHLLSGKVVEVTVLNERVAVPQPIAGREGAAAGVPNAFGPADYILADVQICSSVRSLTNNPSFKQERGSSDLGTAVQFRTADGFVLAYPKNMGTARVDVISVTGGGYETPRGIKVGDPMSRVNAVYGTNRPSDQSARLIFAANANDRIEEITLECLRPEGQ